MMFKLIHLLTAVFIFGLMLFACQSAAEQYNDNVRDVQRATNQLIYTKDSRTNLCYASREAGRTWRLLTNVPCTDEVNKAIKGQ